MRLKSMTIPLLLVGNKCDEITGREVSIQEGRALASNLNCDFTETSTKTNLNVEEAFCNLAKKVLLQKKPITLNTTINKNKSI
jgi:GTPase KRas